MMRSASESLKNHVSWSNNDFVSKFCNKSEIYTIHTMKEFETFLKNI